MSIAKVWQPFSAPLNISLRGAGSTDLELGWHGVAALELRSGGRRLHIDPFVSRPSLRAVLTQPLQPDTAAIDRHLPSADIIALGHAHYDHLLDVPYLAHRDDAVVVGSRSVGNVLAAAGVPQGQFIEVGAEGGVVAPHDAGEGSDALELDFIPSRHAKVIFGRVPYPGHIEPGITLPARAAAYRMGHIYAVNTRVSGVRVLHLGSADVREEFGARLRTDILCVGVAGFARTPDYLERLLKAAQPQVIIPIHWDAFFSPLEQRIRMLPNVDASLFVHQCASFAPEARIVVLQPGQRLRVHAS